ncbi:unnamed protein product [Trichogramma brassicae]|uniref:Uncharacterized protein n=1 Tax=Trichogramma brassicae TaxID=86971 RepID=A0A6H5IK50_9HYME|nr:unnamed protein product [Trichogramma brassicae]
MSRPKFSQCTGIDSFAYHLQKSQRRSRFGEDIIQAQPGKISSGAGRCQGQAGPYTPTLRCDRKLQRTQIRVLLENGADPNVRDAKGLSPLQVICQGAWDNCNLMQMLLEISLINISQINDKQVYRNLAVTATEGDLQMIKINFASPRWIESEKPGSDCQKTVNNRSQGVTRRGATSLHLAVDMDNDTTVSALLDAFASVSTKNECLDIPLHIAWDSVLDMVHKLLHHQAQCPGSPSLSWRVTHLLIACGSDHLDAIKGLLFQLLDNQFDFNKPENDDLMPLHYTVEHNAFEAVDLLSSLRAAPVERPIMHLYDQALLRHSVRLEHAT